MSNFNAIFSTNGSRNVNKRLCVIRDAGRQCKSEVIPREALNPLTIGLIKFHSNQDSKRLTCSTIESQLFGRIIRRDSECSWFQLFLRSMTNRRINDRIAEKDRFCSRWSSGSWPAYFHKTVCLLSKLLLPRRFVLYALQINLDPVESCCIHRYQSSPRFLP